MVVHILAVLGYGGNSIIFILAAAAAAPIVKDGLLHECLAGIQEGSKKTFGKGNKQGHRGHIKSKHMSFRAIVNVLYHACIFVGIFEASLVYPQPSVCSTMYERSKYRGYHHVIIEISLGPMATFERKKNRGRIMIIHFSTPYFIDGSGLA